MANKRFVKTQAIVRTVITLPTREERIAEWQRQQVALDKLAKDEYRYCLTEAKRQHPEWTLAQRQDYARNSAHSLFD